MSSIDLHKPQSSGMDFLSTSMLDSPSLLGRRERGSRFAKFFAKREEETGMPMEQPIPPQGKSISVNDLFGGPVTKPSTDMTMSYSQGPERHSAPRMLSEEEVLQSLGAKRSPPPPSLPSQPQQPQQPQQSQMASGENAMGFDKVLQILSQPKPTGPNEPKNDTIAEEREATLSSPKPEPQQPSPPTSIPEAPSPVHAPAEKQHARTDSTDSKPKLVGKAFAGNLPTSVLRQMSARSSEGRSPSIASTKSASRSFVAGSSSSAGGSPALSNHSPAAVKSGIPLQQQQANSPGTLPYASNAYRMPSPAYHLPHSSPGVDQVPRHHQPRNLEQLLQYGDGLSPPMMARNGNGPMLPHPFQGQAAMEQFIPPHMMQPMPPHMGPIGPMLQPHHLPPQLQAHQFSPMQRDMMTPPTANDHPYMGAVPPPHMMGNGGTGLPPHLFAKGWDRH
ncbi:hypothetical protein BJV82DRAFT_604103 [Fennellomyces sp. T-0311]|nr:hypothetical protein BJV82DRAFT_604103 [Fennellomyces sp. T-0311]